MPKTHLHIFPVLLAPNLGIPPLWSLSPSNSFALCTPSLSQCQGSWSWIQMGWSLEAPLESTPPSLPKAQFIALVLGTAWRLRPPPPQGCSSATLIQVPLVPLWSLYLCPSTPHLSLLARSQRFPGLQHHSGSPCFVLTSNTAVQGPQVILCLPHREC